MAGIGAEILFSQGISCLLILQILLPLSKTVRSGAVFFRKKLNIILEGVAIGLRYLRWGGDGEAVQPEK